MQKLIAVTTANPTRATLYVVRDITFAATLLKAASSIPYWESIDYYGLITSNQVKLWLRVGLWISYWILQGMVFAGIFCLGTFPKARVLTWSEPCIRSRRWPWVLVSTEAYQQLCRISSSHRASP